MLSANSFFKSMRAVRVLLPSLALVVSGAHAVAPVPAQDPLLNITGGGVAPNFMLTLDDSGSMHFRHMPENVFAGGTYATANPAGTSTVRWDPLDNYNYNVITRGTVPGNINSTNYVLRALRSSDTNTLFYNPETLYRPWLTSAAGGATRLPDSPVAKAYKDPLIRTGAAGTYIDLTATTTVNSGVSGYCYARSSNTSCTDTNSSFTHDPGVYFRLQTQSVNAGSFIAGTSYTITTLGSTDFTQIGATSNTIGVTFTATGVGVGTGVAQGYKAVNDYTNYTGYSINGATSFPKVAARTDCPGAVCTQAQERQNFANWFTYYRTRNLLARGAMMEAFANVGNTIRVGFGRINKPSASVDGVSTKVIESNTTKYGGGGVRAFDQTRKDQLFKWLEDLPANGGTPLPTALDTVGKYYSRTDAQGPYTDDPSVNTNVVANNKTCRRSYQLMVTDGYWNESTPPAVGDQDSTAGSAISGGSYTFPANTRPYTDGFPDTLADVAMKYWKNDLQPDVGGVAGSGMANKVVANSVDPSYWQSMTNFMVGLGVRGNLDPAADLTALTNGSASWKQPSTSATVPANIDDLWHAALNSRGAYYSAKDPASLAAAITGALAGAQGGTGATAGVATVSSVLQNGNRKYVPTYNGSVWSGDISAQPLDVNGQATAAVWNAAARLPAWNSRNIYTWDTGGAVAFNWGALSAANQAAMTFGSSNLVDFLKGDHSQEVTPALPGNQFRERKDASGNAFVLGDFVNSNPVLVKGLFDGGYGGLNLGGTNAYQVFTAAKTARDAVLFVGGNDGMLHGFKDVNAQPPLASTAATDGVEVFAYVPRTVYPDLYKLSDKAYGSTVPHKLFVDGPQREFDAFVAGPAYPAFSGQPACLAGATCWRNYLMGSLGAGGRAVYALDVTSSPNLSASNIRWEISSASDPDLGYVMAPIEVGVLPNGKWVAIFGNGFSSNNEYATLFVVDLETAAITKLNVDTSGSNGLGGVGVIRDSFGQITSLYAGDLKGNLWKFDYNTPSVPFVVSGGAAFFTATGPGPLAQAITQPPSIFDHSLGGKIIVFGTGKLFTTSDGTNTDTQTIYGVWDKPADTMLHPLSRSLLASRALSSQSGTDAASTMTFYNLAGTSVDWSTQRGWYIDLSPTITGGRVVYPSQTITSQLVLVTAVAPPQSAAVCDASTGIGVDFIFQVEPGATSSDPLFDTNGDGVINASDGLAAGVQTSSVGIRAVVRGVSGGTTCSAGFMPVSAQNATGQTMVCVPIPPPLVGGGGSGTRVLKRIERRIINPPIR
ncbi:pilus assembly protein [Rhodoferax sp.]|uniref:pilus assembly protein n=1 Tax=Rhodoferax sp. TaxID=50421 RepID=UPI0027181222|nr:PilC/PilY family type IV pilus protein [Rhodoferax sp.]MDO9196204.1 PilC/PilY family type IV pilus protein [Rhodoferax sp.]